jgi:hypothetical protein
VSTAPPARRGLVLEVVAVCILAVATMGTAWCGYQASRWNNREGDYVREASAIQVDAARLYGLASQTVLYDTMTVTNYAAAVASGNDALREFYDNSLVRPDFRPILERWQAEIAAGEEPGTLLEDEDYIGTQLAPYEEALDAAAATTVDADEAGQHSDDYVLTTLLLASALFLAGLTSSFRSRTGRLLLLAIAVIALSAAAARLTGMPVA